MALLCGRWTNSAGAGVLALALSLGGCVNEEPKPPPLRAARVIEVEPQQSALSAEGSGRIEARNTASVGFLVAGRLIERSVDVGAAVRAGDLVARIDPTDFQNKLAAAQAQVVAARASVDQAVPQEARQSKLLADGFTTKPQYEAALSTLRAAEAQLQATQASAKLADDQLKYTQLLAPTGGVVTATGADVGQVVAAGQMIVQLAQEGDRDAVFAVAPQQVGQAHVGMPVKVWLQDQPSVTVAGKIREIAPNADPVTGAYQVKVALPEAPEAMRLGAVIVGRAEVPGEVVVHLPGTALLQTGDQPQVWVVSKPDDVVSRRPVKILRYDADSVVIASGLKKGELVVTAGVNSLADGQKVALQKVAAR